MMGATLTPRAKTMVMAGTLLGLMVSAVNQTVVSTALPRIIGELGGLSLFTWVFTAYMLTSTTTVPLVGKLGDMYGRKPFFMAGIVIFMAASALAGLSQNMTQLIIFRGMQGVGGGALMASAFAIIGDLYAPAERGRYMGLFTAVFGVASILGPTVGGTITDHLSWRWVFYVNVPFGLVALIVLWFGFPWTRPTNVKRSVDYLGVATLSAAVVPLLLALVWAGDLYAWDSPQIVALLTLAALGAIAFVHTERRAEEPIIPPELFRNRVFVVASGVTFLMGIGMFGAITFMPMFVQGVLGASATNSGVVTTPMMLGIVVSSTLAGLLVSRIGKYRLLVVAGGIVLVVGMYLLSLMSETTSDATAIRNMVVVGVGIGIGMPILGLAVQNALPYRLLGVVSSSQQFFRQIGGTLGVAIFGTLVTTHLRDNLQQNLPPQVITAIPQPLLEQLDNPQVLLSPTALEELEGGFAALGAPGPELFEAAIGAMRMTLSDGLGLVFVVAFVVAIVALLVSVALPEVPLRGAVDIEEEGAEIERPPVGKPVAVGAAAAISMAALLPQPLSRPHGWWERRTDAQSGNDVRPTNDAIPAEEVASAEVAPSGNGSAPIRRSFLFDRWPRIAARHPWRVLAGALVALVAFGAAFVNFGGDYGDSFSLPGTESQELIDLLEERFPQGAGDSATIVVRAPAGFQDPVVRSEVETLLVELGELPEVVAVGSPYQQPGSISADGTIARISVAYQKRASQLEGSSIDALLDVQERRSTPEFQVEAGGRVVFAGEREPQGSSELFGLGAAVIILLIAFGSVVAMGLPILTALLALASGFFLIGVSASFFKLPSFTPQFAAMIGIGVGIDYALLIVTRFREGLARHLDVEDAIARAAATAGRSVLFAGTTVMIALLGLWAVGIPFIGFVGTAAALMVALSVVVALVVLPAILGLTGRYIDRWRIPLLSASAQESETGIGYRLSRVVQRAPLVSFALSLGILLVLAAPVLSLRLGSSDAGNNPKSSTSRRAYDLLSEGFGPGFNGPILVGVAIDDPDAVSVVEVLPSVIAQEEGVVSVSPPRFNEDGSAATITLIPETSPQSEETGDLVDRLRRVVPETVEWAGLDGLVGGSTATFIDVGDRISSRMPLFFTAVIGLSFLLLMAVFRSVLIPLKAALMNLLSIGAAYGVLVAVFQWGWFGGLLGVERQGPIESFVPMMLFAVLFGLSMDYEVFLVSRIQEEYLAIRDNSEAVARGLSVTTRVISAAALIMVAVFLSFAISDQRVIKEFGIGLATAIFLDATLVRLILVPSIMQLMGKANWWFPPWLDRIVPRIGLHDTPMPLEPALAAVRAGVGGEVLRWYPVPGNGADGREPAERPAHTALPSWPSGLFAGADPSAAGERRQPLGRAESPASVSRHDGRPLLH